MYTHAIPYHTIPYHTIPGERDEALEFSQDHMDGTMHFMRFESRKMESFIEMARDSHIVTPDTIVCCTGMIWCGITLKICSLCELHNAE